MRMEGLLPNNVCATCASAATAAAEFRALCQNAARHWNQISDSLVTETSLEKFKSASLFLNLLEDGTIKAYKDKRVLKKGRTAALKAFKAILRKKKRKEDNKLRKNSKATSSIKCPDCGSRFASHVEINKHLKYTNLRSCFNCSEIVPLQGLKEHLSVKHKLKCFVCSICSEVFSKKMNLQVHSKSVHRRRHYCVECRRSFRNAHSLTAHKFVHERRTCNGCSKTFTNNSCFQQHVKRCEAHVEEPNKYTCDECGKLYKNKDTLRVHIGSVHIRGRLFQCHVCSKGFFSESHLKEHSLVHDKDPDRFPCEFCDSKYSTRRGFEKHIRKHIKDTAMAKEYLKLKKIGQCFYILP